MKKVYILTISLGMLLSCGGGGDNDSDFITTTENKAPTTPLKVYPLNNTLCVDNAVKFEWNESTDPDNNSVSYKLEVSETNSFSSLSYNETSNATSKIIVLPKGKAYYWRVKAVDNKQAESTYSSSSQFLTEGEGVTNNLPFLPVLAYPELNAEIVGFSVTLSWTASDVDNDTLTFDVYLDTNSNPTTKVSENQTETTYTASNLTAASTYYLKVIVKDGNGGITIGQIWNFKTK
ncbi:Fibronectin type III domain-containing protein [Lutibacter agarilyticus]|uniref:Fibronectin type III domain-containing protein n=1 Tax=Lutibacter agarilyticus TaxID=1109740 RepID=A0A238Y478_9FLAO|nr:fibronectin type III domain-containing protein [Lutibacter agarilyticus]SNR66086.1 Fibronectin type III domain-containing protein [Lutibacter agarilyticus]